MSSGVTWTDVASPTGSPTAQAGPSGGFQGIEPSSPASARLVGFRDAAASQTASNSNAAAASARRHTQVTPSTHQRPLDLLTAPLPHFVHVVDIERDEPSKNDASVVVATNRAAISTTTLGRGSGGAPQPLSSRRCVSSMAVDASLVGIPQDVFAATVQDRSPIKHPSLASLRQMQQRDSRRDSSDPSPAGAESTSLATLAAGGTSEHCAALKAALTTQLNVRHVFPGPLAMTVKAAVDAVIGCQQAATRERISERVRNFFVSARAQDMILDIFWIAVLQLRNPSLGHPLVVAYLKPNVPPLALPTAGNSKRSSTTAKNGASSSTKEGGTSNVEAQPRSPRSLHLVLDDDVSPSEVAATEQILYSNLLHHLAINWGLAFKSLSDVAERQNRTDLGMTYDAIYDLFSSIATQTVFYGLTASFPKDHLAQRFGVPFRSCLYRQVHLWTSGVEPQVVRTQEWLARDDEERLARLNRSQSTIQREKRRATFVQGIFGSGSNSSNNGPAAAAAAGSSASLTKATGRSAAGIGQEAIATSPMVSTTDAGASELAKALTRVEKQRTTSEFVPDRHNGTGRWYEVGFGRGHLCAQRIDEFHRGGPTDLPPVDFPLLPLSIGTMSRVAEELGLRSTRPVAADSAPMKPSVVDPVRSRSKPIGSQASRHDADDASGHHTTTTFLTESDAAVTRAAGAYRSVRSGSDSLHRIPLVVDSGKNGRDGDNDEEAAGEDEAPWSATGPPSLQGMHPSDILRLHMTNDDQVEFARQERRRRRGVLPTHSPLMTYYLRVVMRVQGMYEPAGRLVPCSLLSHMDRRSDAAKFGPHGEAILKRAIAVTQESRDVFAEYARQRVMENRASQRRQRAWELKLKVVDKMLMLACSTSNPDYVSKAKTCLRRLKLALHERGNDVRSIIERYEEALEEHKSVVFDLPHGMRKQLWDVGLQCKLRLIYWQRSAPHAYIVLPHHSTEDRVRELDRLVESIREKRDLLPSTVPRTPFDFAESDADDGSGSDDEDEANNEALRLTTQEEEVLNQKRAAGQELTPLQMKQLVLAKKKRAKQNASARENEVATRLLAGMLDVDGGTGDGGEAHPVKQRGEAAAAAAPATKKGGTSNFFASLFAKKKPKGGAVGDGEDEAGPTEAWNFAKVVKELQRRLAAKASLQELSLAVDEYVDTIYQDPDDLAAAAIDGKGSSSSALLVMDSGGLNSPPASPRHASASDSLDPDVDDPSSPREKRLTPLPGTRLTQDEVIKLENARLLRRQQRHQRNHEALMSKLFDGNWQAHKGEATITLNAHVASNAAMPADAEALLAFVNKPPTTSRRPPGPTAPPPALQLSPVGRTAAAVRGSHAAGDMVAGSSCRVSGAGASAPPASIPLPTLTFSGGRPAGRGRFATASELTPNHQPPSAPPSDLAFLDPAAARSADDLVTTAAAGGGTAGIASSGSGSNLLPAIPSLRQRGGGATTASSVRSNTPSLCGSHIMPSRDEIRVEMERRQLAAAREAREVHGVDASTVLVLPDSVTTAAATPGSGDAESKLALLRTGSSASSVGFHSRRPSEPGASRSAEPPLPPSDAHMSDGLKPSSREAPPTSPLDEVDPPIRNQSYFRKANPRGPHPPKGGGNGDHQLPPLAGPRQSDGGSAIVVGPPRGAVAAGANRPPAVPLGLALPSELASSGSAITTGFHTSRRKAVSLKHPQFLSFGPPRMLPTTTRTSDAAGGEQSPLTAR